MKKFIIIMLMIPGCTLAQSASYLELQTTLSDSLAQGQNEFLIETVENAVVDYQQELNVRYLALTERAATALQSLEERGDVTTQINAIEDMKQYIETSPVPTLEGLRLREVQEVLSERRTTLLELTMKLRAGLAQL